MDCQTVLFSVFSALSYVANDIMIKVLSQITYEENDDVKQFKKPITMTFFIFIGVMLVWVIDRQSFQPKPFIRLIIPSIFYTFSLVVFNFAVVYGKASICFIIRHSIFLFMPIVTAGKIPRGYQFFAIGIIVIATIFAFLANEGPIWPPFAALCSQIFKVFQIFFEKKLLHEVKILDSQIVSGEGICAFIFSAVIILPLAYVIPGSDVSSLSGGALENVIDGLSVMFSSVKIILGAFILILSAFLSSSSTVLLPGDRQSVHFVVIDIIVSVLTWTILLIMGGEYGELLSTKSIWQIFALILYAFASLVYNQIIRFKCFRYSEWTLISNQEKPIELLEDID